MLKNAKKASYKLEILVSNRIQRVNSLLEQEISKILLRYFDFSGAIVTLTRIEATPNLIEAKAYVSAFPEDKTDGITKTLNKNVYEIQQKINKKLNMRPIPKIIFVNDTQAVKASRVEELLEKLKKEQK